MKTRLLLWLVTAAAIAVAILQRREIVRIGREADRLEHRRMAATAEQEEAARRRAAAEERNARLQTEIAQLRTSVGGQPMAEEREESGAAQPLMVSDQALAETLRLRVPKRPMISAAIWPTTEFRLRVGADPVLLELYRTAFFASVKPLWGPFFKQMELTPDQMRRFTHAQWELEQVKIDSSVLTAKAGINFGTIRETWNRADLDMKTEVRALLGGNEDKNAQYHTYSQQSGVRPLIGDLAGILAGSETPLTKQQTDALAGIFSEASQKTPGGWAIGYTLNWDSALPKTKDVLAPAQFTALRAMATQEQSLSTLKRLLEGHR